MTATAHRRRRPRILPETRPGWWAVGLAVGNVLLVLSWSLLGPLGAFPGFACGLAAGIVALIAVIRHHERALAVFAAMLPLVMVPAFVVLSLVIPA